MAKRLCDIVDPTLIEHCGRGKSLADLQLLGQMVEGGQHQTTKHFDGVREWPTSEVDFIDLLRSAHLKLFESAMPTIAGRFRRVGEPVLFGGRGRHKRVGVAGNQITAELGGLFQATDASKYEDLNPKWVALACAEFLVEFFRIHPFADGNGRIGRWTIVLLCRLGGRFELRWSAATAPNRRAYIRAVEFAHDRRLNPRNGKCPPGSGYRLLADWIEPQLYCAPDAIEEADPPEQLGILP